MTKEDIKARYLTELPRKIVDGREETYTEWLERRLISLDKLIKEKSNTTGFTGSIEELEGEYYNDVQKMNKQYDNGYTGGWSHTDVWEWLKKRFS